MTSKSSLAGVGTLLAIGVLCTAAAGLKSTRKKS